MTSPDVFVRRPGKVTRYNSDKTANVKFRDGPGRPHKVSLSDILFNSDTPSPPPEAPHKARHGVKWWAFCVGLPATLAWMLLTGACHEMGARIYSALAQHFDAGEKVARRR